MVNADPFLGLHFDACRLRGLGDHSPGLDRENGDGRSRRVENSPGNGSFGRVIGCGWHICLGFGFSSGSESETRVVHGKHASGHLFSNESGNETVTAKASGADEVVISCHGCLSYRPVGLSCRDHHDCHADSVAGIPPFSCSVPVVSLVQAEKRLVPWQATASVSAVAKVTSRH